MPRSTSRTALAASGRFTTTPDVPASASRRRRATAIFSRPVQSPKLSRPNEVHGLRRPPDHATQPQHTPERRPPTVLDSKNFPRRVIQRLKAVIASTSRWPAGASSRGGNWRKPGVEVRGKKGWLSNEIPASSGRPGAAQQVAVRNSKTYCEVNTWNLIRDIWCATARRCG
jgi:hypothetical protein